jgi:fructose-1,6-bisphosphatase class II
MDRTLVLEYTRVTEAAAIAASSLIGRGDGVSADAIAVKAMRTAFERVPARGTIVIGEGERDEAPMLFIGEKVGPSDPNLLEVDIAVDPLEGTNLCANGLPGALAVLAVAHKNHLLNAPDTYMAKIACGPEGKGKVSLEQSPRDNLWALAAAKGRRPDELTVVVLDRPRHQGLIQELRAAGARILLVTDGDVAPVIATCIPKSGIDMVYGTGGAPEGVLGAAAIHCLGGEFQGKLQFRSDEERERAIKMGMTEPDKLLRVSDLARGDVLFVATGVTTGPLLKGVRRIGERLHLQSLALRSTTGTIRWVNTDVDAHRYTHEYEHPI